MSVAVIVIVCVLWDAMDNNGTELRGREGDKLEEFGVESRAAAEETNSRCNPRVFICPARQDIRAQICFSLGRNHCYLIAMKSTRP